MRDLKILGLSVAGFMLMMAASAWAAGGSQDPQATHTPCITPPGALFSTNCNGVSSSGTQDTSGSSLGDTTSVPDPTTSPSPSASPSLTPGTISSPEATATPESTQTQGSDNSGLPVTGAVTAVSSVIGLSAIAYAGFMYYKRRKLANEPVRPMRASSADTLDIARIGS